MTTSVEKLTPYVYTCDRCKTIGVRSWATRRFTFEDVDVDTRSIDIQSINMCSCCSVIILQNEDIYDEGLNPSGGDKTCRQDQASKELF